MKLNVLKSYKPSPTKRRWKSFLMTLVVHVIILVGVVVFPVVIYEAVSASEIRDTPGLEFSGGVTYFIYASYWIAKIKNLRGKFILLHLLSLLATTLFAANFSTRASSGSISALPIVVALVPALGAFSSWFRKINGIWITCAASILITLPLGVCLSFLILYGGAMSSMGGLRY